MASGDIASSLASWCFLTRNLLAPDILVLDREQIEGEQLHFTVVLA